MRVLATVCVGVGLCSFVPIAQAAENPLFVFTPKPPPPPTPPTPPPTGFLNGSCGIGVAPSGNFYVSDYYHDAIDAYSGTASYSSTSNGVTGFLGQLGSIDSIDGPCGLAFDPSGHLYVNDYHRRVIRYGGFFPPGTTIAGAGVDESHPSGVAIDPATGDVYVDARDHIAVYDESGAPVVDDPLEPEPLRLGANSLRDGYGLAFSTYPATAGYLYVPDAASNAVEVYDPATDKDNPIEEIDGSETPNGEFVSLRDASIAVDRVSGDIYVIDDLQPEYTERPQAIVYVFDFNGTYKGHLKFLIRDGLPSGVAVDNSSQATQGRVYVTSGNTSGASIYAYGPGAATTAPVKLATARLSLASVGAGDGVVGSSLGTECSSTCEEEVPGGASVSLSASPDSGSVFAGWSGACQGTAPSCTIQIEEAASVRAAFAEAAGPAPAQEASAATAAFGKADDGASLGLGAHRHRKAKRHRRLHREKQGLSNRRSHRSVERAG